MRRAAGYLAMVTSIALLLLSTVGASPAFAWDNAAARIVKETGSGSSVCVFHIDGTGWDRNGRGTWSIGSTNGSWQASSSGNWSVKPSGQPWANGSYTLRVRQSTPNAGGDRSVNFAIKCDNGSNGNGGTSGGSSTTGGNGTVTCPSGNAAISHSGIRGATEGGTASVTFTVAAGCSNIQLSLVSYKAPSASFDANTANQQTVFSSVTRSFSAGTNTMSVSVPSCFFQVDFVRGGVIATLGPAGSNNFYSAQGRLLAGVNGGSDTCAVAQPSSGTSGTTGTTGSSGASGSSGTSGTSGTTGSVVTISVPTVLGIQTAPQVTAPVATVAAPAPVVSAPQSVAAVQTLPSTRTEGRDTSGIAFLGLVLMAIGGGLLRRKPVAQQR